MDEFDLFYSQLTRVCGKRETITKSLFHLLVHENKHNSNVFQSNANRLILDIIDKRKHKNAIHPLSFNNLPAVIASKCASYLQLSEVTRLCLINRHAYTSCKSIPTSVTSLMINSAWFVKYLCNNGTSTNLQLTQAHNFHQFRGVKHLVFRQSDVGSIALRHWNLFDLDTLRLEGEAGKRLGNVIARTNISHLELEYSTFVGCLESVCCNTNIEYLTLMISHLDDALFPFPKLSKLKGIVFKGNHALELSAMNHQYQSLHVHNTYHATTMGVDSWKGNDCSQLQELCVSGMDSCHVRDILESAIHLKRLHFSVHPLSDTRAPTNREFDVPKIALSRKSLQYLSITTSSMVQFTLFIADIIMKIPKRECFKLRLNIARLHVRQMDDFAGTAEGRMDSLLLTLIKALEALTTKDFMLLIQCRSNSYFGKRIQKQIKAKQIGEYYQTYLSVNASYMTCYNGLSHMSEAEGVSCMFNELTLAVCNRNNTMGGYKCNQMWDVQCRHLDQ
eukprot:205289_1